MKRITKLAAVAVLGFAAVAGFAPATATAASTETKADIVLANDLETYTFHADRGDAVLVGIRGDGSSDLDFAVIGPDGEQVLVRNGPTDRESGVFVAPSGGTYRLGVWNRGSIANAFTIRVIR